MQVVDYLSEVTKALIHITRPAFEHIDNNHTGLTKEQIADLMRVNDGVDEIFTHINEMMRSKNFTDLDKVLDMRDRLFDTIVAAIKSQLRRMDEKAVPRHACSTSRYSTRQIDGIASPKPSQIAKLFP